MTRPWSYWSSPAARSDPSAWTEIVERYAQLVWSICTWFQLSNHDYEDVRQNVWLLRGRAARETARARRAARMADHDHAAQMPARGDGRPKSGRLGTRLNDAPQFVDDTGIDQEIIMQVPALVAVGKGDIGFGIPGGGAGAWRLGRRAAHGSIA